MKSLDSKREAQRIRSNNEELIERMSAAVPADGTVEAFPGFRLSRASAPTEPVQSVYPPSFCFVAQGSKRADGTAQAAAQSFDFRAPRDGLCRRFLTARRTASICRPGRRGATASGPVRLA